MMVAGFWQFCDRTPNNKTCRYFYILYYYTYIPTRGDITSYTSRRHRKLSSSIFFYYSNIDVDPRVKRRSHYIIKMCIQYMLYMYILYRCMCAFVCVCMCVYMHTMVHVDCWFCAHFAVRFALRAIYAHIVTRPAFTRHASFIYIIHNIIIHASYLYHLYLL
jgi:hypothetical protein